MITVITRIFFLFIILSNVNALSIELTCQGAKRNFSEKTKFILISTNCPHCHLFIKKEENQSAILLFKENSRKEISRYISKHDIKNSHCLVPKHLRKSFYRMQTPKIIDFTALN